MDENQERALFVRQEYRYVTAKDDAIRAVNPKAREIEIQTNLNEADAETRANNELAANDNARVFEVEIEGLIPLSAFVGGPPSFIPNLPEYGLTSGQLTVVSATIDYNSGITRLQVRG